ncbi:MAG: hypothetical protein H0X25_09135 [Acidobacteriales bacterium]|nr:hypothetical protein [Terriglobales bacterium]
MRSLAIAMSLYVAVLAFSLHLLKNNPPSPWKYLIAIAPVLPVLWVPVAVVRFLREVDELQRKIQIEAIAFGFTFSAVLTLGYGFLQNVGLPQLNWTLVWPLMAISWIIGLGISSRRYR